MNLYIYPLNICRTLLALNTLTTLVFNSNYVLFGHKISKGILLEKYGIFFLFSNNLDVAKIISVIILIIIILGFYPKWTSILHFYISYSFIMACDVTYGADRIASNVTLFLIPLCFFDSRENQFKKKKDINNLKNNKVYWFFYMAVMIQISLIYFQAFHKKIELLEWQNGTAVFYYVTHNEYGLGVYNGVKDFLQRNYFLVYLLTWGALFIELMLALLILVKSKLPLTVLYLILFLGIFFHFVIMFVHGLFPFFLVMSGVLCFYILPFEFEKSARFGF